MLKGSRKVLVKKVQPVSIHGQISLDVYFVDPEEPDGQVSIARVGPSGASPHGIRRPRGYPLRPWCRDQRDAPRRLTVCFRRRLAAHLGGPPPSAQVADGIAGAGLDGPQESPA